MHRWLLSWMMVVLGVGSVSGGEVFEDPVPVTDSAANYRMTRNPSRQAAFDSEGTLHAVWWSGTLSTAPETPSEVFYASWSRGIGWSAPQTVDDSYIEGDVRVGGRQPSLTLTDDGAVWVVWQDHRHCRGGVPYSWIDNVEVYADVKPPGGSFSTTDIRLTTTVAEHFGDNAYSPRILAGPDGAMRVIWYDFHFNSGVADLFLKDAPAGGAFDLDESMTDMRRTRFEDRPPNPPFGPASLTQPELVATDEAWFAVWSEGVGLPASLWLAAIPEDGLLSAPLLVGSLTDGYTNPASVRAEADGSLWIGWTDRRSEVSRVMLRRRNASTGLLENSWLVTDGSQRAEAIAFELDSQGLIHAVWVEVESYLQNRIRYAVLDPVTRTIVREELVTPETGAWVKPCVVLDGNDVPHVLFGEFFGDAPADTGDIWFAAGVAPEPGVSGDFWSFF
jgi:hypothetical protein